ncbi:hypothetical protein DPF_2487 [Desulfoplanes formicivorans]|uniref:Uncharacterized protein n=1 Tax=Desulfoplanes formicivorans TaxID=1592317 RepID=A0A194AKI9_9BACT|nr:hypothetical protein DPF_2487 [Desulfoplanes formicivorans]
MRSGRIVSGRGGSAVLLALAVMDSEDHSVKVDILHPQFLAFEEPELATI